MSPPPPHILIADDQPDVIAALRLLFKGEGWKVTSVGTPDEALAEVERKDFDLVLMDLNYTQDTTSGREGLQLLERIRSVETVLPVVIMTAWANVELAVDAMQRGAGDFVEKPWDNNRLLSIARNQIALGRSIRRARRLEAENRLLRGTSGDLIAESRAMQEVVELAQRVAPSDANILLTGEHGTGKSLLAAHIHRLSARAEGPLVVVNMGGLADSVFESEMFGHERGAFTDAKAKRVGRFEMADGGTLFMDEVANIPLVQQAKLLRVLESGEFEPVGSSRTRRADVRIIAATNADLGRLARDGGFREDLLFRFNTVEIALPPLRQRPADIAPLAELFLARHAERYGTPVRRLSDEALARLGEHAWPGNVRELSHVIERSSLLAEGGTIGARDLLLPEPGRRDGGLEGMTLEEAERTLIAAALERTSGNVRRAARELGLSRSALYRRLEKFGLTS